MVAALVLAQDGAYACAPRMEGQEDYQRWLRQWMGWSHPATEPGVQDIPPSAPALGAAPRRPRPSTNSLVGRWLPRFFGFTELSTS